MIDALIIGTYLVTMTFILIFSFGQLHLTWIYKKNRNKVHPRSLESSDIQEQWPRVTIQLPVYNEKYVIERLIEQVCSLDYPGDRLEIQVLDDSTDETTSLAAQKVSEKQALGIDILHIRRPDRKGFKAGALEYGLKIANGEFLAIFDADFLPKQDFLKKTVPYFSDTSIGMVQTRWGHLNKEYSLLTRLQAFGLDGHFTIEQSGRNLAGSFINFNGTAGVWRKKCIEIAGGWSADTLTEDLDLSYRAQLKGWKFHYLEDVLAPAELPILMPAIKSQQYRWNKGAAETARKNLKNIWNAKISTQQKFHAVLHLLNNSGFIFILLAALLSVPMLSIKAARPELLFAFHLGTIFILGFLAIAYFYWQASRTIAKASTLKYWLFHFPLFMTFSMGLAFHNAIAVMEGYLGKKTPFIRTPKFNLADGNKTWKKNQYIKSGLNFQTLLEGFISIYFAYGVYSGIRLGDYGLIFFHIMLALGFGGIFIFSIRQSVRHAKL